MDRLGAGGGSPVTAFSHGAAGIIADQTHYFEGFALMLRIAQGVAVSVREHTGSATRVVIEGVPDTLQFSASHKDVQGFGGLLANVIQAHGSQQSEFDISIVGGIPTGLGAAFHAAVATSLLFGLDALRHDREEPQSPAGLPADMNTDLRDAAIKALSSWYGHRFSPAFVIASMSRDDDPFVLVDTGTLSYLPVVSDASGRPGWAIIEASHDWKEPMAASIKRSEKAANVTRKLQKKEFDQIKSLRDIEHRDLERALQAVGRRHRSALRHLVSENRNVQKGVVAVRKGDWQFLGALMMISQASKTNDWDTTGPVHEMVTDLAESASLDGIFGVVQTGEGGCMLVAGQPFSLPAFLDSVRENADEHTSESIETFII
jgi:galactokinase